jgi:hypothetical protein
MFWVAKSCRTTPLHLRDIFRHPCNPSWKVTLHLLKQHAMEDPAYKTYLDSLTFGDDTTIGYFDLSDPLTPEQCGEDKAGEAGDEQAAGGKWIKDKDMKLKLEHLVS